MTSLMDSPTVPSSSHTTCINIHGWGYRHLPDLSLELHFNGLGGTLKTISGDICRKVTEPFCQILFWRQNISTAFWEEGVKVVLEKVIELHLSLSIYIFDYFKVHGNSC